MEQLKWHEVSTTGFKFGFKPEPEMLEPEGQTKIRTIKLRGKTYREPVAVTYDRSYVVAWLAWYFFNSMPGVKFNELQKLFGEAFALAKEAYNVSQRGKATDGKE